MCIIVFPSLQNDQTWIFVAWIRCVRQAMWWDSPGRYTKKSGVESLWGLGNIPHRWCFHWNYFLLSREWGERSNSCLKTSNITSVKMIPFSPSPHLAPVRWYRQFGGFLKRGFPIKSSSDYHDKTTTGLSGREPAPAGAALWQNHPARHAAAAAGRRHGALLTGLQRRGEIARVTFWSRDLAKDHRLIQPKWGFIMVYISSNLIESNFVLTHEEW